MSRQPPELWGDKPVEINGVSYSFASSAMVKNGTLLWGAEVGLASCIADLVLKGPSIELGCGQGLVGMVANAVLVDIDPVAAGNTRETLKLNNSRCRVLESSWENITDSFDNVFGSEILYRMYNPASVVDFLIRCWTGRGVCLFSVSDPKDVFLFEQRAASTGFSCSRHTIVYQDFEFTLVQVEGP